MEYKFSLIAVAFIPSLGLSSQYDAWANETASVRTAASRTSTPSGVMQITTNTTPFLAEIFVPTDKQGSKHCVVVIKGAFDVAADGQCCPAAEQAPFVYADEHYGDPGSTAIRYDSDFARVKPLADVLVHADAVAPEGRPVTTLDVALGGPGFTKRARVTGDRRWEDRLGSIRASWPQPFVSLPLSWDRAFGGSDFSHEHETMNGAELRNLVGVGFHLNRRKETIVGKTLPNIERVDSLMESWSDKPVPIGFGPLGRGWQPRIGFAGTYDQRWIDERLPFLPEDFDDRYFQSAPADQQLARLAVGDRFSCLNMSERGRFVVRLPQFQVPLRFRFADRTESRSVSADTLILEPGSSRIILTGRAGVPLPRKFINLHEIEVGRPKRTPTRGKPHFRRLGEAVTALRRQR